MASPYKIHLETYDGPLDLLLDLIKKQEIDIHNIPIAKITGQYLDYLHKLEQLDMDVSADFIYMAATLIYIKSKMLLPPDPLAGPEELEDPRADLVHRLVEHEKFKSAAQLLHQRQQIEEHVWSKPDRTLYEGEDIGRRADRFARGPRESVPAGAGAPQGSSEDRAAPRAIHRGANDGFAAPAISRRRGRHRPDYIFRVLLVAACHDCCAACGPRTYAATGDHPGTAGIVLENLAAKA